MGRAGPNIEQLTRDLETLLAASAAPAAADAGESLDMTQKT